ncbi:tubulin-tyrosine ligase [Rhizophagus irregularis DAOM 181602=DAOM 197198]|nr:tubulin-tyrosine ligase [Rhizophagus irregularis DAOM 181602=DAOM 197198]POG60280.1 tubulin-tyrosine ligase [Rhizophagus irregularis DAOM 181602=DAOM 197198]|eukprot:XP_025167146.1 tubulin-tyrosine ligase [Rhizophagus irregularis DAOM 181602=DAOM 197198]
MKEIAIVGIQDDYTRNIIIKSLKTILPNLQILEFPRSTGSSLISSSKILFWLEYEDIEFDQVMSNKQTQMINTYCIRKGLIRKANLNYNIQKYISKNPNSILKKSTPETWFFEVIHIDYLDEALEEIFEVVQECKENDERIEEEKVKFILKPSLGNKGAEIKIFYSIEQLRNVFEGNKTLDDKEDHEEDEDEEKEVEVEEAEVEIEEVDDDDDESMFHIREWVIQRYISNPLLINNRKFHIRSYILAISNLRVYLYKEMLALFALNSYSPTDINNSLSHLTNTCLQVNENSFKESNQVKLFWDLSSEEGINVNDLEIIFDQIKLILNDCFESVSNEVIQFMPLENAFELFGFDFLVDQHKNVYFLEANSFPDFKQTGDRLSHVISSLFEGTIKLAVAPFFKDEKISSDNEDSNFCLIFNKYNKYKK